MVCFSPPHFGLIYLNYRTPISSGEGKKTLTRVKKNDISFNATVILTEDGID